jgi:hypothetical protein
VHPTRVVNRKGALAGLWAAGLAFAAVLGTAYLSPGKGLFNDYYDYWAAAKVLNQGGDPYDPRLIGSVLSAAGVHASVGDYGYSYPLILAELMRPLTWLSASSSAVLFFVLSTAALAFAIAVLLSPMEHLPKWELFALATACAAFSPIDGSLYFGQVNLLILPLLVLASQGRLREPAIAISTAVKLYPSVTAAAFLVGGRREMKRLIWCLALMVALGLIPNLLAGQRTYSGSLRSMFGPDTFWSDQSVNGFLSRLALRSQWTVPPLPGLPVTPVMLFVCVTLGISVLVLLRGLGRTSWLARYSLLLWYGAVAAPKNSLWNFAPLVIVFAYCWSDARRRPATAIPLVIAYALLEAQQLINVARDTLYQGRPALTWLSSLGFYAAMLMGAVTLLVLLAERRSAVRAALERPPAAPTHQQPEHGDRKAEVHDEGHQPAGGADREQEQQERAGEAGPLERDRPPARPAAPRDQAASEQEGQGDRTHRRHGQGRHDGLAPQPERQRGDRRQGPGTRLQEEDDERHLGPAG